MSAIRLDGTPNFRDLGGLKTSDGRAVRPGILFRSEGPSHLTASDKEILSALDLRLVCDLRSVREGGRRVDDSYAGYCGKLLNLDVAADLRVAGNEALEKLRRGPSVEFARQAMRSNYQSMMKVMGPHLAIITEHMLAREGLPMMIHCEAGKDRTGVAISLLLRAIDVRMEEVLADYEKSNESLMFDRFDAFRRTVATSMEFEPEEEFLHALIATHPSYLQAAFDEIVESWGSLDAYLEREAGLSAERRTRLKDLLLQPSLL